jgi:hypothetical protein
LGASVCILSEIVGIDARGEFIVVRPQTRFIQAADQPDRFLPLRQVTPSGKSSLTLRTLARTEHGRLKGGGKTVGVHGLAASSAPSGSGITT